MSPRTELEPKVAEIRRRTRQWFATALDTQGLRFDRHGHIAFSGGVGGGMTAEPEDPADRLRRVENEWDTLQSTLDELELKFERFYDLDPLDLTIMGGKLGGNPDYAEGTTNIHDRIGVADDDWMRPVLDLVVEQQWIDPAEPQWISDGAKNFRDNFAGPFHDVAERQQGVTTELAIAVRSYHDAVSAAQRDINTIADSTINLLMGIYPVSGTAASFNVVSIVATAVGIFLTGGAAIAAGVISLGAGLVSYLGNAADTEQKGPVELRVDGSTAQTILESAWDAIVTLEGLLADVDQTVWQGLNDDLDAVNSFGSPDLRVARPDIADDPTAMGRLTIAAAAGVPIQMNPLVVSLVDLYRSGFVNLPEAAGEYDLAIDKLDTLTFEAPFSHFFPRSLPVFIQARARFRGIMADTRDSLVDAGTALIQIATTYQVTDEESAERMRQIGLLQPVEETGPQRPNRAGIY